MFQRNGFVLFSFYFYFYFILGERETERKQQLLIEFNYMQKHNKAIEAITTAITSIYRWPFSTLHHDIEV